LWDETEVQFDNFIDISGYIEFTNCVYGYFRVTRYSVDGSDPGEEYDFWSENDQDIDHIEPNDGPYYDTKDQYGAYEVVENSEWLICSIHNVPQQNIFWKFDSSEIQTLDDPLFNTPTYFYIQSPN
jgi:hypothetical protein